MKPWALHLLAVLVLAATPEFWQAVQALGDRYYYPPTEMAGMPRALPPR